MERKDSVLFPFQASGAVVDFGGTLVDETGNEMKPLPGANDFFGKAIINLRTLTFCTSQSIVDAKRSLKNVVGDSIFYPTLCNRIWASAVKNRTLYNAIAGELLVPKSELVVVDDSLTAVISALLAGYGYAFLIDGARLATDFEDQLREDMQLYCRDVRQDFENRVHFISSVAAIKFPRR